MSTVVETASALVQIPSVNPDGGSADPALCGEESCARWVGNFLSEAGAEVSFQEVQPGRPNVIGRFPHPGKPKGRILFAPHLDTVGVEGMTVAPFGGEIREGCLWGRGASDTKGSVAAMLCAVRDASDWLDSLPYEIWFAGLAGEEVEQIGSRALAAKETFSLAVVGEPTGLQVVHTHKGSGLLTLRTRGVAVHASTPEKGTNAILEMAEVIEFLRREVIPAFAIPTHPVLGHSTLSVGTIHGGTKVNVVPDFCEALVNLRNVPGSEPDLVLNLLKEKFPDLEINLRYSPPFFLSPSHPLVQQLVALGANLQGAPWFCDAAVFAAEGTPAVAIGPGSLEQAHTANEFIRISDLEHGYQFFLKFLRSLSSDISHKLS